jgi:hypothetical protein
MLLRMMPLALLVALPLTAAAQPVMPNQPLGQPAPAGPQDSDILRRSQRALPDQAPANPPGPGGLGSLVRPDGRIVITRELCQQASIEHHPAPDVTYHGGTDVYGRPVAPADLPGSGTNYAYGGLGSQSSTDLLSRSAVGARGGVVGETYVGRVTVDAQGHTLLNGQPIDPGAPSELQQLCARAGY